MSSGRTNEAETKEGTSGEGSDRGVVGKAKDAVAEAPQKVKGMASGAKESVTRKGDGGSGESGGGQGRPRLRWLALPAALAGAAGAAVYAVRKGSGDGAGRNGSGGSDDEGLVERGKQVVEGAVAQVREAGGVKEAATGAVARVREAIAGDDDGAAEAPGGEERQRKAQKRATSGRDPDEMEDARRERQIRREGRRRARG